MIMFWFTKYETEMVKFRECDYMDLYIYIYIGCTIAVLCFSISTISYWVFNGTLEFK